MRHKRKLARGSIVATLAAFGLFVSGSNAFADSRCAYFVTSQRDIQASENWTWGSWPVSGQPGPNSIYIKFQSDGNLVAYRGRDNAVMWASGTYNDGVVTLVWSASTGGIKLMRANGVNACTIRGNNGASGGWAQVQDDGNFVFYKSNGVADWAMWSNPSWPGGDWRNYCAVSGHN
ncbi:hypothetical protein ACFXDJ_06105 [Streptomyces sp. NPDC059443]|uniref:hypothetical protein n=1 Tax=unclassified Streptomyces TaxID=2593676 RepID=UPI0036A9B40D